MKYGIICGGETVAVFSYANDRDDCLALLITQYNKESVIEKIKFQKEPVENEGTRWSKLKKYLSTIGPTGQAVLNVMEFIEWEVK